MNQTQAGNGFQMEALWKPFADFWKKFLEGNAQHTELLLNAVQKNTDQEAFRRQWSDSMAQSLDAYLRSPPFLEAMRCHFELLTLTKTLYEDMTEEFSRNFNIPRATDISGLFERLQMGQEAILNRLEQIASRLEALEKKG